MGIYFKFYGQRWVSLFKYAYYHIWIKVLVAQLYLILCDPMDCSPSGFSVHGIFQARILEWVSISFSRGSSQSKDQTWVSCTASWFFTVWVTKEAPYNIWHTVKYIWLYNKYKANKYEEFNGWLQRYPLSEKNILSKWHWDNLLF